MNEPIIRQPILLDSIREIDYPKLNKLWESAGNKSLMHSDSSDVLTSFLYRNPTCSYAAHEGSRLVGAILAGHDRWHGYLYQIAVNPDYRERSIGTRLVSAAITAIKNEGVEKINCLVKCENLIAQQFWESCGFERRDDVFDYSIAVKNI